MPATLENKNMHVLAILIVCGLIWSLIQSHVSFGERRPLALLTALVVLAALVFPAFSMAAIVLAVRAAHQVVQSVKEVAENMNDPFVATGRGPQEAQMDDLEAFDPKELHRQIMNEFWSLYQNAAVNEEWIDCRRTSTPSSPTRSASRRAGLLSPLARRERRRVFTMLLRHWLDRRTIEGDAHGVRSGHVGEVTRAGGVSAESVSDCPLRMQAIGSDDNRLMDALDEGNIGADALGPCRPHPRTSGPRSGLTG
jgi:hypothetical protein